MIEIRPMQPSEEAKVRELSRTIYDGALDDTERPLGWHQENSTLVAVEDGALVGHTSYHLTHRSMFWDETVVAASHQGRGLGRQLMEARLQAARDLDCPMVIGAVRENNDPMVHLLLTLGLQAIQRIPGGYGIHGDAILYVRRLSEN